MSFGADTDIFAFAATGAGIFLQGSSLGNPKDEARAMDSHGDIDARTFYHGVQDWTARYLVKAGNVSTTLKFWDTTNSIDFRLGKVINGVVLTSVQLGTANNTWPTVEMSGRSTNEADSDVRKFKVPTDMEITVARKAIAIGITEDTNTRVTGSTATASVTLAEGLDSQGEEGAVDVHEGNAEASADLVGVTGDAGASAAAGWTASVDGTDRDQANTEYETGSFSVVQTIDPD